MQSAPGSPHTPEDQVGTGQVTLRNSSGSEFRWELARKPLRSSSWASMSVAVASAWRARDAVTRSLPLWTNSGIEMNHRTGSDSPARTWSGDTWGLYQGGREAGAAGEMAHLQVTDLGFF